MLSRFQLDAVGAVDEPVKHGVGDGRVAHVLVPVLDGSWLVTMVDARSWRSSMISHQIAALLGDERERQGALAKTPETIEAQVLRTAGAARMTPRRAALVLAERPRRA